MICNATNVTECFSCQYGSYHDGVSCTLCPAGCLICQTSAPACLQCDTSFLLNTGTDVCECNNAAGYFLDTGSGECKLCSFFSFPNCLTCTDTSGAGTIECQSCISGHYLATTTSCAPCGAHCLSCTSPTSCSACAATFTSNVLGSCYCDDTTVFYDSGSDLCQICSFFDSNCLTCST